MPRSTRAGGDQPQIIDHISDINMPLTEQARGYLLAKVCGQRRSSRLARRCARSSTITTGHRGVVGAGTAETRANDYLSSAHIARRTSTTSSPRDAAGRADHPLPPVWPADRDVDASAHAQTADGIVLTRTGAAAIESSNPSAFLMGNAAEERRVRLSDSGTLTEEALC